jgi:hypothetical protein
MKNLVVQTRDQFGTQTLTVLRPELLCVPSDERVIPKPQVNDESDRGADR